MITAHDNKSCHVLSPSPSASQAMTQHVLECCNTEVPSPQKMASPVLADHQDQAGHWPLHWNILPSFGRFGTIHAPFETACEAIFWVIWRLASNDVTRPEGRNFAEGSVHRNLPLGRFVKCVSFLASSPWGHGLVKSRAALPSCRLTNHFHFLH